MGALPSSSRQTPSGLLCLLLLSTVGCLAASPTGGPTPAPADDGGEPPSVWAGLAEVEVRDWLGHAWPVEGAPRNPVIQLAWRTDMPPPSDELFLLLRGGPDAELEDDLEAAPLRIATLGRVVPVVAAAPPWALRPAEALEPGASYALVIPPGARDLVGRPIEAQARTLTVSQSPLAGARLTASWPPDGAVAVPPARTAIDLRFDGPVVAPPGSIRVLLDGEVRASDVLEIACATVGWSEGSCLRLVTGALPAGAEVEAEIGRDAVDLTGAPVGPDGVAFRVASTPDVDGPVLRPQLCGFDEASTEVGCVFVDDSRVEVRFQADEAVRATLLAGPRRVQVLAPRGAGRLGFTELLPETVLEARLELVDLAEQSASWDLVLATTGPLAPVAIVEVRSDPEGPEPRQEYVELLNFGAMPVDLAGFSLSDDGGREGDRIEGSFRLDAGARVLLVAAAFDPEDPADAPVPPGVPLLRLDTALGSGGLANRGEPLFLRDGDGQRLSAAPALPAPGACLVRVGDNRRTAAPDAFAVAPCTPGR